MVETTGPEETSSSEVSEDSVDAVLVDVDLDDLMSFANGPEDGDVVPMAAPVFMKRSAMPSLTLTIFISYLLLLQKCNVVPKVQLP